MGPRMSGTSVWFAPTLAAARRAARTAGPGSIASPNAPRALTRALADGSPVAVVDPPRFDRRWEAAKRRFLLPAAPEVLRGAISGIAPFEPGPGGSRRGPARAHWIPGNLTDRRARALLSAPPVPTLWIVEDFRRVRLSAGAARRLEEAGVRLAAFRALNSRSARTRRRMSE